MTTSAHSELAAVLRADSAIRTVALEALRAPDVRGALGAMLSPVDGGAWC